MRFSVIVKFRISKTYQFDVHFLLMQYRCVLEFNYRTAISKIFEVLYQHFVISIFNVSNVCKFMECIIFNARERGFL